jgi:hypothetical protein
MGLSFPGNKTYKIKEGDTLEGIAKSQLGKDATPQQITKLISDITNLNADIIKNPNVIIANDTIAVPKDPNVIGKAQTEFHFFDSAKETKTEKKAATDAEKNWAKALEKKVHDIIKDDKGQPVLDEKGNTKKYPVSAPEKEKYKAITGHDLK